MAKKISGRIKRAISSSLILFAVAGVLAASNVYSQNRDRQAALGPEGKEQEQFFVSAVDRPDISAFFKRFKSEEKVQIAKNLRRYQNPKIVKLAVIWLTDFDADARSELQSVLIGLAPKHPKELAAELDKTGGFQKLGVASALKSAYEVTLPPVIDQLGVASARSNAVEYLASSGKKSGAAIVNMLDSEDKDTRLAAADAIGKVGYLPASSKILNLYSKADVTDKSAYLSALANLGDKALLPTFQSILTDEQAVSSDRSSAILGLGRIGNDLAAKALWAELDKEPLDRDQIIDALILTGDVALKTGGLRADRLEVAGGIQSELADQVIEIELARKDADFGESELAANRPRLARPLLALLGELDPNESGRKIESTVRSLLSTSEGKQLLLASPLRQRFDGFIQRELAQ